METAGNETFFMLYVDGQNAPTHKHSSLIEAETEAQRLLSKTGKKVFILQGIKALEPMSNFKVVDLVQENKGQQNGRIYGIRPAKWAFPK